MTSYRIAKLGWLSVACLALTPAFAKSDKPVVPSYLLDAHTVAVVIDPNAGISPGDPNANQTARQDVEQALLKWGRFTAVLNPDAADLVIVLRRGHGKLAETTISDPRQNNRHGDVSHTDDGVSVGVQRGSPRGNNSPGTNPLPYPDNSAHPQTEVGNTADAFLVFEGNHHFDEDGIPGWKWIQKNGLHPHNVPAVDEFRKALEEADKQVAAQQKTKHP
ncbi:MAG: hypothetical protein ABUS51_10865 [Acidobacteriota bacterium]